MSARVRRCPRCRHDQLSIAEVVESIGVTDFGRVVLNEDGTMVPPSPFNYEPGDIVRVHLVCEACRHEWRSRSSVGVSDIEALIERSAR